jgi:hypothetical protein
MEMEDEQDESDRMATFEVRKSNEQEEAVNLRPGFQVCLIHYDWCSADSCI